VEEEEEAEAGCNKRGYSHNQKIYSSEESHAVPARPSCAGHAGGCAGHRKVKKIR